MAEIWKTPEGREAVRARYAQFLQHWPKPCEQLRVPTSQGETFVIASGRAEGPAVVMLHGSASNSVVWMRDAAVLGERFRVYAVDMIGEPRRARRLHRLARDPRAAGGPRAPRRYPLPP